MTGGNRTQWTIFLHQRPLGLSLILVSIIAIFHHAFWFHRHPLIIVCLFILLGCRVLYDVAVPLTKFLCEVSSLSIQIWGKKIWLKQLAWKKKCCSNFYSAPCYVDAFTFQRPLNSVFKLIIALIWNIWNPFRFS